MIYDTRCIKPIMYTIYASYYNNILPEMILMYNYENIIHGKWTINRVMCITSCNI